MNRQTASRWHSRPAGRQPLAGRRAAAATRRPRIEPPAPPAAGGVVPAAAVEQPIARFIRVTGTLMAEEQADVAAETAGRVVATPVERGTPRRARRRAHPDVADRDRRAAEGSGSERRANRSAPRPDRRGAVRRERGAGGAEREGVVRPGAERVQPHPVAARPARRVAVGIRPAADADGSGAPAVRSRRRTAPRSSIRRCRPRAPASTLARKALADTVVRAPFTGLVAQRLVSVGDYVTKGMKVAVVVRVNPLRVQLTVPEQFVVGGRRRAAGGASQVDAYPGRQFEGKVRYVSPALAGRSARAHGRGGRAERQTAS